nr:CDT1-like protein A, chloroplastic [Ipomoea batatas]
MKDKEESKVELYRVLFGQTFDITFSSRKEGIGVALRRKSSDLFSEKLEGKEIELESKLKELDGRTGNLETLMSKMEEVRQAALKLRNLDPERPAQADPLLSSTAGQIDSQPEPPPAKPKKSEGPAKLPEK